ncbi:uncharacterized protein NCBP2-AS2 homolog [Agrilus planipennis]|uniref:Uncharacterized protein NCBP2-AS2 homolog n=1 Tax=Agrilus planipennis TaxID=224129 RepID=A0A7F5R5Q8_AGRPL|nr:uncharacterized protein NCBP2-AS2 homolog [Agrilus planipennis]
MVLRLLLKYLVNNEQLVHRLSQSYPVRRAAQLAVLFYMRSKHMMQEKGMDGTLTPEQFKALIRNFQHNLQKELKDAHEKFKSRKF